MTLALEAQPGGGGGGQGQGGPPPGNGAVPIDGGAILLAIGAAVYGRRKIMKDN
ncbi:MAG: MprA protease, GlyGly-CTERM protein-sorting domain-containing form [Bacteroidetes bacterium]|nr:MprA protease, GlyGly-CTERM protein-sorting domain-containing form [Bacteroidota bacterium]